MVVLLLVEEGIVSYLAPRGKQSTGVARPSSSHLSFAHRVRSLSFVIVSQVDDDTLTPYRPGRDCCVQGGEGSAVTPPRVGPPQVGACRDCHSVLASDRSAAFEYRLAPHSCPGSEGGCASTTKCAAGGACQSGLCWDVVGRGRRAVA